MSNVKTDVKDINETRKTITVSLTSKEVAEQEAALIKDFQRNAKIPGFRPGKAPEAMVRTRYAKDLKQELKQRVISKAHQEGVAKSDVNIFKIVDLSEGEIAADKDAEITFTVDIVPEFEVPEYTGLKVTNEPTEATNEEIDKMIEQILSQRAEFNVAEKAAEKGDYVRCGYEGKIGDELVADLVPDSPMYGTQKVTWEEAGAEGTPGVSAVVEGLVGMKAGDEKEVTMVFPEDFKPEALAGKTAVYSLKAEEVREKVMPEMNEEFFKSVQVKDEAELRERIRENIENQKKQKNAGAEREQVTKLLLDSVDFAIPESGIESETEAVLRDFMQRNMQQGVSAEEFEKHKEQLHEGASAAARDRLKSRLILSKIAEKEKIKAENDDFSRMIMMEAQQSGQKPDKVVKEIQKDRSRIDRMRGDIILGKTMDLIIEKAERETVEASA
ncbi:MAG: trigger factor [Opitutales bacterium]|jgi:trigger factor|nr:trigger factor [Opitutales bacterium]MDP4643979.1 trigger factor [Opitutales bacterium]MDP4693722.1 trigger factor [Opitutales bacterium]MDP4777648.1 trigger factor [Opitutales bacterium]MDP4883158.1 trigger factor [Opitutales bacterium]